MKPFKNQPTSWFLFYDFCINPLNSIFIRTRNSKMQLRNLVFSLGLALMSSSALAAVTLNGSALTQDQAWSVANGEIVKIDPKAMKHLTDSFNLVNEAARQGAEIYGLTVGVGLNKDHHLFDAKGELTEEAKKASTAFNKNILRSHSVGFLSLIHI